MITISIKIKREDKEVMMRLLENEKILPSSGNIYQLIFYEKHIEILSKLYVSRHNDKAIRLDLTQTFFCILFLKVYACIGTYESANAHIIKEDILKQIRKKAEQLINS